MLASVIELLDLLSSLDGYHSLNLHDSDGSILSAVTLWANARSIALHSSAVMGVPLTTVYFGHVTVSVFDHRHDGRMQPVEQAWRPYEV